MNKLFFTLSMGMFVNLYAQTVLPSGLSSLTTENYVYSRTYLDATTTSSTSTKQIQSVSYLDGLGRPKQAINIKASPKGNDLVTIIPYDGFGRQADSYLPVSMISANGGIQNLDPSGVVSYYTGPQNTTTKDFPVVDANPFSHKTLEASPLDRVRQQVQVGNAWSNKPVTFGYETNTGTEVKKFVTTTTWPNNATSSDLTQSGNYGAAQLYKNTVTDEDGNVSIEFKNGEGQTLLVRKNDGTKDSDTYYVYNEYNQLAFVIQPEAAAKTALSQTDLDELCYQYRYDGRSRLVEKKLPGKDWEYMVYDSQDRLVMTQDANLGALRQWLFTKYDQFGRVAYTGIYTSSQDYKSAGRAYEQGEVNGKGSNNVEKTSGTTAGFNSSGLAVYYDNLPSKNYPNTITKLLSVNYYDTYPTGSPAIPPTIQTQAVMPQTGILSTKSLPTASYVNNVEANGWTKNYIWYDTKGRTIGTHSINYLGGYTKTESLLDFAGVLQKTMTYHKRRNTDTELVVKEDLVYDHQNRLLEHYHEVVGKSPVVSLAKNTYNEIGQLVRKEVGRSAITPLQTVDYTYNIRGWMTGINSADIAYNAANGSYVLNGGKLFGYNIRYNDPANPSLGSARYNGNIAEVDWMSRGVPLKRYGYQYDGLNRLLKGNYQDPGSTLPESHINDETLTYDLNGNIRTLVRNAKHAKNNTPVVIDNLDYNQYQGNKILRINDLSNNASGYEGGNGLIGYDANGNMTGMPDKGISSILYNHLNLPNQINQNTNVTNYYYRADGVKLRKKFTLTNAAGTKTINTEYLDGFQYSTPNTEPIRKAIEEQDDITMGVATAGEEEAFSPDPERKLSAKADPGTSDVDNVILSFFPTAEGYYDYENLRYIYQYKDHLGNVRVSYVKNSAGVLQVMDSNDYYPFGMSHLKNTQSVYDPMAIPYNYKYNGKELQETGMYDYGARMYMADIGRWFTVDPLAEQYTRWSPFNYAMNNPIRFIDPDGRKGTDWVGTTNANGSTSWKWDDNIKSAEQAETAGYDDYRAPGSIIDNGTINGEAGTDGKTSVYLGENANDVSFTYPNSTVTPFQVGTEWLSGTGPRNRNFTNGDVFTEMLRQHSHVGDTRNTIIDNVANGGKLFGDSPYKLGGFKGVGLYLKDYSTLLTGGLTGNLAVTYLGSYNLNWTATPNYENCTIGVNFSVNNTSTMQSASRPPVLGYLPGWQNTVGNRINTAFQSGWGSKTSQSFNWTETIPMR